MARFWFIAIFILFGWNAIAELVQPEAFKWECHRRADNLLEISVNVFANHYLYYEQVQVEVKDAFGKTIPPYSLPSGITYSDPFSGTVKIIPGNTTAIWIFKLAGGKPPFYITIDYQGCRSRSENRQAICFPPGSKEFKVSGPGLENPVIVVKSRESMPRMTKSLENLLQKFKVDRAEGGVIPPDKFIAFLDNREADNGFFSGKSMWLVIALIILGGLGLNLTPCVLPMIPINLAIIGAGVEGCSKVKGFLLGSLYGAGIAITYGTIGLVTTLTGSRFGVLNSSAWFNFTIAVIFIMLGLALLGIMNIDFSRFSKNTNGELGKGRLIGALIAGIMAALLAGACVAPVVIAVIMLATDFYRAGASYGLFLPFLLGLGMALPWPLAGAGFAILPKPGVWMQRIKMFFAIIVIAAGGWYAYLGINLMEWGGGREK